MAHIRKLHVKASVKRVQDLDKGDIIGGGDLHIGVDDGIRTHARKAQRLIVPVYDMHTYYGLLMYAINILMIQLYIVRNADR